MTEKFNPAPKDKHAEDPNQAQNLTRKCMTSWTKALRVLSQHPIRKQRAPGAIKTGCG
jgi:hypothetical protein